MTASQFLSQSLQRLIKLLRWRVWLHEKFPPSDWRVILFSAAIAGVLGALSAIVFTGLTEDVHSLLTGSHDGVVETMRQLSPFTVILVTTAGGVLAGIVLLGGKRLLPQPSSTDYMEAIAIGSGQIPLRASLVKCGAALFSIGSGGSIGREGPLVQLAAVVTSLLGRWQRLTPPRQRLLVACGAAAGIASAYNAPIAGSFFIAEIILGSLAMESLGPLVIASVAATLTLRVLTHAEHLYAVPTFRLESPWEMIPYVALGLVAGVVAPWFLRSLRRAEAFFLWLNLPLPLRLGLGGLLVGALAVHVPEVCGNGYTVVLSILNGELLWHALLPVLACKWLATAASFGSGAPGGVFTPSLFVGASAGYLFGSAVHMWWPVGAPDPRAFALVGMGAFLSAASHAPIMAIIMLFEMTLSYDIVLPLMLCSVVAYYTARELEGESLYSEALRKKAGTVPAADNLHARKVDDLIRPDPPIVLPDTPFERIAQLFWSTHVNHLYVVDAQRRFAGVVSLHDIKAFLNEPALVRAVIANDILREDFPRIRARQSLGDALGSFRGLDAERLPVLNDDGVLVGSLAKGDLLLTLAEQQKPVAASAA